MFNTAKDFISAIAAVVVIGGVTVAIPIMGMVLGVVLSVWVAYYILADYRKGRIKNQQSDQRD